MKNFNEKEAENLVKAIDIAIESIKRYTPDGFSGETCDQFIKCYLGFKSEALNPEPQYKNQTSLKYLKNEIFTYFQESSGKAVEFFWSEIKEAELPYKRENRMAKILKRGKINNSIEYNFVIDVIIPFQQQGLISSDDAIKLNTLIGNFEKKKKEEGI